MLAYLVHEIHVMLTFIQVGSLDGEEVIDVVDGPQHASSHHYRLGGIREYNGCRVEALCRFGTAILNAAVFDHLEQQECFCMLV